MEVGRRALFQYFWTWCSRVMRPPTTPPRQAPDGSGVTPQALHSFRSQLSVGGEVIDPSTWAGSVPHAGGVAPRIRVGHSRWFNLLWLIPVGFVVLIAAIAAAKGLRNTPPVADFITAHPGTIVAGVEPDIPWWMDATHFVNLFLLIFILRSGLQIISDHPRLYWTRNSTPGRDWFRIQKPVPTDPLCTAKQDSISLPGQVGLPGIRHFIGLARWWHMGMDTMWLANGARYVMLLFTTGQWRHVVPTSWEAAPLAVLTGLGMSPALSTRFTTVSRWLSIQAARSLHFLVLCYFLVFVVIHVGLVATSGLLRSINHVFAARDATDWIGFGVFAAAMVLSILGWVAATPFTLRRPRVVQRVGYALIGPLQRLFEHVDARPGSTPTPTSPRTSGTTVNTRRTPTTEPCTAGTSLTTGCGSTGSSSAPSSPTSARWGSSPVRNRSPRTSASKAGPGSPSGAGCPCRPSSTSSDPPPKPGGWCSTPSVTAPTAASTTTPTPSSR